MELLISLALIALCILVFFLIQTLLVAQTSLQKMSTVLSELESKLDKLTSFVNTVENVSDITEKETQKMKLEYLTADKRESIDSGEMATWLVSSIKLGLNFLKRR